jgi:hypothetical protein
MIDLTDSVSPSLDSPAYSSTEEDDDGNDCAMVRLGQSEVEEVPEQEVREQKVQEHFFQIAYIILLRLLPQPIQDCAVFQSIRDAGSDVTQSIVTTLRALSVHRPRERLRFVDSVYAVICQCLVVCLGPDCTAITFCPVHVCPVDPEHNMYDDDSHFSVQRIRIEVIFGRNYALRLSMAIVDHFNSILPREHASSVPLKCIDCGSKHKKTTMQHRQFARSVSSVLVVQVSEHHADHREWQDLGVLEVRCLEYLFHVLPVLVVHHQL